MKLKVWICAITVASLLLLVFVGTSGNGFEKSAVSNYRGTEELTFRVMNSTDYVETYALALGDINNDNHTDIVVGYNVYLGSSQSNLSAYEVNGTQVNRIANLPNFVTGVGVMFVDPTNTFVAPVGINNTSELFITGSYNGNHGVYVLRYNDTNKSFDIAHYFSSGTDCALLKENNSTYLAVAGDQIYAIKNGTFVAISNTSLPYGFIKTGELSNDSNIAVFNNANSTLSFYNFTNDTLTATHSLSIDIEVSGWGNDADYLDGFSTGYITNSTYEDLFFVTYHNGYTIVHYTNGTFKQILTGVLNTDDYNAMSCAVGKLYNLSEDSVVIGFGNYIYAPLYEVYHYKNGTFTSISKQPTEDGNTRVLTIGSINGNGSNEVIVGSASMGYVRVIDESQPTPVPELNNFVFIAIATVITALFIRIKRK